MPCPICEHTMEQVGRGNHWCPRCGTILLNGTASSPGLVRRVQLFASLVCLTPDQAGEWHRLGLNESVGLLAKPTEAP